MLIATLLTVALFIFVLVAGNVLRGVFNMLASGQLSWGMFLYILAILIPGVVPYALPMGLSTGTLLVLGRLSAQNEILAMRAAGFSFWRIAAPIFLLAVLSTGVAAVIDFYYAPMANATYKRTIANVIRDNPLRFVSPRTFISDFPGFIIYVNERRGDELKDIFIWELYEGQVYVFVKAKSGRVTFNQEKNDIELSLTDGSATRRDRQHLDDFTNSLPVASFDKMSLKLSLSQILGGQNVDIKLSFQTFGQLLSLREKYLKEEAVEPVKAFVERIRVQMALQQKMAYSFSVLSLCLISIPLGIKASRSETYANLAIALGVAMVYYLCTVIISWVEPYPHLRPDLLIWIPNLVFQAIGLIIFARFNKR